MTGDLIHWIFVSPDGGSFSQKENLHEKQKLDRWPSVSGQITSIC